MVVNDLFLIWNAEFAKVDCMEKSVISHVKGWLTVDAGFTYMLLTPA